MAGSTSRRASFDGAKETAGLRVAKLGDRGVGARVAARPVGFEKCIGEHREVHAHSMLSECRSELP